MDLAPARPGPLGNFTNSAARRQEQTRHRGPPTSNSTTPATEEPTIEPPVQLLEQDSAEQVTTPTRARTDLAGLRAAYDEDAAVHIIIDHFASRQYNQNITELDALRNKLEHSGTPVEKPALVRALRRASTRSVSDDSSWDAEESRRDLSGSKNR